MNSKTADASTERILEVIERRLSGNRQVSVAESSVAPSHQNPDTQLLLQAIEGLKNAMASSASRNSYSRNSDSQANRGQQGRTYGRKLPPGSHILCESCETKGMTFCLHCPICVQNKNSLRCEHCIHCGSKPQNEHDCYFCGKDHHFRKCYKYRSNPSQLRTQKN